MNNVQPQFTIIIIIGTSLLRKIDFSFKYFFKIHTTKTNNNLIENRSMRKYLLHKCLFNIF